MLMLSKKVIAAIMFSSFASLSLATNEATLVCHGLYPLYQQGFGNSTIDAREQSSRTLKINLLNGKATINSIFGTLNGQLTRRENEEQTFTIALPINRQLGSDGVLTETIVINRLTGQASGLYSIAYRTDFMSFSGDCRAATRLF